MPPPPPFRRLLTLLLGAASLASAAVPLSANIVNATSPLVSWVGRRVADAPKAGAVLFDWVGVSASVTLDASVTYVTADITDNCHGGYAGGGSRWLVTVTTADGFTSAPNHRVSTFWSSPYVPTYVLWTNQGGRCDPE